MTELPVSEATSQTASAISDARKGGLNSDKQCAPSKKVQLKHGYGSFGDKTGHPKHQLCKIKSKHISYTPINAANF